MRTQLPILRWINKILASGTNAKQDEKHRQRVQGINGLSATLILVNALFIPLLILGEWWEGIPFATSALFLYVLVFLLNRWGGLKTAILVYSFGSNLYFLIAAIYFGREAGLHYAIFVAIFVPIMYYDDWKGIVFWTAFAILCLGICFWTFDHYPRFSLTDPVGARYWIITAAGSVLLSYAIFFKRANNRQWRITQAQQQKLEAQNAELEMYLNLIAHDLQTPVQGIHKLVEFMDEEMDTPASPEWNALSKQLRAKTTLMHGLLTGLLEYQATTRKPASTDQHCDTDKVIQWFTTTLFETQTHLFTWQVDVPSMPIPARTLQLMLYHLLSYARQETTYKWPQYHLHVWPSNEGYIIDLTGFHTTVHPAHTHEEWINVREHHLGLPPKSIAFADKIARDLGGAIWLCTSRPLLIRTSIFPIAAAQQSQHLRTFNP